MNQLLSPSPLFLNKGLAIVRIIIGLMLVYHGQEVFDSELMKGYTEWDNFKTSTGKIMVYIGKSSELLSGILLTLGLFTRLGAIIAMGTLAYITFFVGHGHFWYEDQHPFMFVMFGLLFFFTGPGAWSVDALLFRKAEKV